MLIFLSYRRREPVFRPYPEPQAARRVEHEPPGSSVQKLKLALWYIEKIGSDEEAEKFLTSAVAALKAGP